MYDYVNIDISMILHILKKFVLPIRSITQKSNAPIRNDPIAFISHAHMFRPNSEWLKFGVQ